MMVQSIAVDNEILRKKSKIKRKFVYFNIFYWKLKERKKKEKWIKWDKKQWLQMITLWARPRPRSSLGSHLLLTERIFRPSHKGRKTAEGPTTCTTTKKVMIFWRSCEIDEPCSPTPQDLHLNSTVHEELPQKHFHHVCLCCLHHQGWGSGLIHAPSSHPNEREKPADESEKRWKKKKKQKTLIRCSNVVAWGS